MTSSSRPARLALALALLASCSEPPAAAEPACSTSADCTGGQICTGGACGLPADGCSPLLSCDGSCRDVGTDPEHCGGCGVECATGVSCLDSACCPVDSPVACDGRCVELSSDAEHCGACGAACPAQLECNEGSCCPAGETLCSDGCRELAADPGACGGCGQRCPSGATCLEGACQPCPAGTTEVTCGALAACLPATGPQEPPCRLEIPAGPFTMGVEFNLDSPDEVDDYSPPHEVTLTRAFFLELTEVTRAAYGACFDAGACTAIDGLDVEHRAEEPVINLTWQQAEAVCSFRGGRLPTEAEWEKAARGTDGRRYPWGNGKPSCGHGASEDCSDVLQPVGHFPLGAGPYGQLDLWANASEWVADFYDPDAYRRGDDLDPVGPVEGTERVHRGPKRGQGETPVTHRWSRDPTAFEHELSVRCAHDR